MAYHLIENNDGSCNIIMLMDNALNEAVITVKGLGFQHGTVHTEETAEVTTLLSPYNSPPIFSNVTLNFTVTAGREYSYAYTEGKLPI